MLCPFCKEEIADGAIKCKHCQTMLNSEAEIETVDDTDSDEVLDEDEDVAWHLDWRRILRYLGYAIVVLILFFRGLPSLGIYPKEMVQDAYHAIFGVDPEALAEETIDIMEEAAELARLGRQDSKRAKELQKRADSIKKKVDSMSAGDRA
jgi:hypothetical protein